MLISTSVLCAVLATPHLFASLVDAAPVQDVGASITNDEPVAGKEASIVPRARRCNDGGAAPCACGRDFGLRKSALSCRGTTYDFRHPNDPRDGSLRLLPNKVSDSQCDHIVELQFIANELRAGSAACQIFAASPPHFSQFKKFINGGDNIVYIPAMVNNVKGKYFGPRTPTLSDTTSKALNGLVKYLTELKAHRSYPGLKIAKTISDELDGIVGTGNGFSSGFDSRYKRQLDSVIRKAQTAAAQQPPYVAPGTPAGTYYYNCNYRRDSGRWSQVRSYFDGLIGRSKTKSMSSPKSKASDCPKSSAHKSASHSSTKHATPKPTKAGANPKHTTKAGANPKHTTKAAATHKHTATPKPKHTIKAAASTHKPTQAASPHHTKAASSPKHTKSSHHLPKLTKGKTSRGGKTGSKSGSKHHL